MRLDDSVLPEHRSMLSGGVAALSLGEQIVYRSCIGPMGTRSGADGALLSDVL